MLAGQTMEARATTLRSRPAQDAARWVPAAGVLALAGATVGTGLDAIHVHTGTTAYAHPVLFGQAWWVPPLFASAGLAIGLGRPLVERVLGLRRPAPSAAAVAGGMALFVLAYATSGLVGGGPLLRSFLLAALFLVAWLLWDRTGLGLVLAVLTAAAGTAVEVTLVRTGTFVYREPSLAGVTIWLPWLYGCAAVGVGNLGKRLVDG
jgi:hypothetical protein